MSLTRIIYLILLFIASFGQLITCMTKSKAPQFRLLLTWNCLYSAEEI